MVRFILLFLGVIFYVFYSQIAGRYALNIHERLMYRLYFCWIRILLRQTVEVLTDNCLAISLTPMPKR